MYDTVISSSVINLSSSLISYHIVVVVIISSSMNHMTWPSTPQGAAFDLKSSADNAAFHAALDRGSVAIAGWIMQYVNRKAGGGNTKPASLHLGAPGGLTPPAGSSGPGAAAGGQPTGSKAVAAGQAKAVATPSSTATASKRVRTTRGAQDKAGGPGGSAGGTANGSGGAAAAATAAATATAPPTSSSCEPHMALEAGAGLKEMVARERELLRQQRGLGAKASPTPGPTSLLAGRGNFSASSQAGVARGAVTVAVAVPDVRTSVAEPEASLVGGAGAGAGSPSPPAPLPDVAVARDGGSSGHDGAPDCRKVAAGSASAATAAVSCSPVKPSTPVAQPPPHACPAAPTPSKPWQDDFAPANHVPTSPTSSSSSPQPTTLSAPHPVASARPPPPPPIAASCMLRPSSCNGCSSRCLQSPPGTAPGLITCAQQRVSVRCTLGCSLHCHYPACWAAYLQELRAEGHVSSTTAWAGLGGPDEGKGGSAATIAATAATIAATATTIAATAGGGLPNQEVST